MARLACLHHGDVTSARLPSVALFDALYDFLQEHQYCGDLDGGVDGDRVWMTCTCGAVIVRPLQLAA
jgi:hypothetical protein